MPDLGKIRANAIELAQWLGITPQAVYQGAEDGRFHPDAAGLYWLRRTVATYCQSLRDSRRAADADDYHAELDYWRARKLRQEVLEGRQEIAMQVGDKILARLRGACARMATACAAHPDTAAAVRALAAELEAQEQTSIDFEFSPDTEGSTALDTTTIEKT